MFHRFLNQLKDPMILILLVAAGVSAVTSIYSQEGLGEVAIILVVVLINAILGVYQESKAEKAIEALQAMTAATSKVLRDGEIVHLKSEELVPGDVVLLEAGDAVPADGRLLESASLKIEEAALTGESYEPIKTVSSAPIKPMQTYKQKDPLELYGAESVAQNGRTSSAGGSYYIQAGSFTSRSSADRLQAQLKQFGSATISPADIDGNRFYRVRIGPYNYQMEADVTLAKIKNFGVYNAKIVQD